MIDACLLQCQPDRAAVEAQVVADPGGGPALLVETDGPLEEVVSKVAPRADRDAVGLKEVGDGSLTETVAVPERLGRSTVPVVLDELLDSGLIEPVNDPEAALGGVPQSVRPVRSSMGLICEVPDCGLQRLLQRQPRELGLRPPEATGREGSRRWVDGTE